MTQPKIIPIIDGKSVYPVDYSGYEIYVIIGLCIVVLVAVIFLVRYIRQEMSISDSERYE